MVSIMSLMSVCIIGSRRSARLIGRARWRSTGCPIRATFRIDMREDYRPRGHASPRRTSLQLLPDVWRRPRAAFAETERAGAAGVRALRFRLLPGPEGGSGHDHPRRAAADRAGAAGDRARLRQVGIPR